MILCISSSYTSPSILDCILLFYKLRRFLRLAKGQNWAIKIRFIHVESSSKKTLRRKATYEST